jgi:endonuclease/exonuclease/phosphatase family metal-dependent hydrolase
MALLVIVVMTYRVLAIYTIREGECTERPVVQRVGQTLERPLRVMTYNVQGHAAFIKPAHMDGIAETINRLRPDIVAINEGHRHTWQAWFQDHVAELAAATGMRAAFTPSYSFMGGKFGNAILTRGEILRVETWDLPSKGEPRTLFEAVVRVNGATVSFYATHLSAWASLQDEQRAGQLACIERIVRGSPFPFIVAGDINAPPEADELVSFLRSGTLALCGQNIGSTHKVMNQRIDHVFASPEWTVIAAEVPDVGPSDHRPVVVVLNLRSQEKN